MIEPLLPSGTATTDENLPAASERLAVLIVDDRVENLVALELVLAGLNIEIVKAGSGREALRRLLERDFALILLDVNMPEMDGFETAEIIRERERTHFTPIIFLTGMTTELNVFKGYESGAVDYVSKPFSARIMKAKVGVFVELYRQRDQINRQAEQLRQANEAMQREIAQRQQMLVEMRRYAAEVSDLYNRAPCGYHSLNREGVFVEINDTELAWIGYTREEVIGRLNFRDVLTPHGVAVFEENFPIFIARGEIDNLEFEMRRKDGSTFYVSLSSIAICDESGKFLISRSSLFDITKRRHAETRLREAMETLDATLDGVFIFDPESLRFTHVNRGAIEQVGYSHDELLAMTPLDIKPEFEEDRFRQMIAPLVTGEAGSLTFTTVHRRKDGRDVPVEVTLQCVTIEGMQRKFVAVVRDITEREEAQRALRWSEEQVRLAVTGAEIGTWHWDLKSDEFRSSEKCKLIFGIPLREEWSYQQYIDSLHVDDRQRVDEAVKQSISESRDYYAEFRIVRPDQSIRWIAGKGRVYCEEDGTAARMEGVAFDITEQKMAGERIRELNRELDQRVAELSTLNREMESFSYSVSHDLRAPLRSIDGFALALVEDCYDQLGQGGRDHIDRVRSATGRMSELIDALLSLSRLTRSDLSCEKVDLSEIARTMADELHGRAPERDVEFVIENNLVADCDRRMIRIVFENLFGNAWKFTQKHPLARIEFGSERSERSENGELVLFVRDDGAGFDPKYSAKLFGAFQRLHADAEFKGTGIGLATVERIIHRHGGRIWATGEVGKGATFYFTLALQG